MAKKSLSLFVLLLSITALAQISGSMVLDQILAPWVAERVAGLLAHDTFNVGKFPEPNRLRLRLLDYIDKNRKDNENFKLYTGNITYSHARNLLKPLFSKNETIDRAFNNYAYPFCRTLRTVTPSQGGRNGFPTMNSVADMTAKDVAFIDTILSAIKRIGEPGFRAIHADMRQGTFQQMIQHLRDLEEHYLMIRDNHYNARKMNNLVGPDAVFEERAKKLIELRLQAINTGLSGLPLDLKIVEGLPYVEQELVKHSYYVSSRKTFLMSRLGMLPTQVIPNYNTLSFVPQLEMTELVRGINGFVVRRCMDGLEHGRTCSDTLTKWKQIIEKFNFLLKNDCKIPFVPKPPAAPAATTPASTTPTSVTPVKK